MVVSRYSCDGCSLTGSIGCPALIALAEFPDTSPRGIAGVIARLVNAGDLGAGDRLPTVRELAGDLGVSPATVSQAWQALSRAGLIESRGRAGSFVRSAASARLAPRMRGMAAPTTRCASTSRAAPPTRCCCRRSGRRCRASRRAPRPAATRPSP